ncbi:MAG: peptidoglycan-associated lipoprotein Pal [Deltaproteobacteria bacterium]|nr:peptidoglycan-associated lipoprotein Pal [Deltaproteobacteria bacterium]
MLLAVGGCASQRGVTGEGLAPQTTPQQTTPHQQTTPQPGAPGAETTRRAPEVAAAPSPPSGVPEGPVAAGPPRATVARKPDMEDIFFAFDQYALTEQARRALSANADFLLKHPQHRVLIEGHADERGTPEYNLALGEKRALAAREYLISLGIEPNRVSTISYGEERPLDPRHNEEAWARNRRDHFVLMSR